MERDRKKQTRTTQTAAANSLTHTAVAQQQTNARTTQTAHTHTKPYKHTQRNITDGFTAHTHGLTTNAYAPQPNDTTIQQAGLKIHFTPDP